MKHFKKLSFLTTASLLIFLTVTGKTENRYLLPSVHISTEENEPEYPIQPFADDDDNKEKEDISR